MWLIFIMACIVVALAALLVIYIGHKIIKKIERDDSSSTEINKYFAAAECFSGTLCFQICRC